MSGSRTRGGGLQEGKGREESVAVAVAATAAVEPGGNAKEGLRRERGRWSAALPRGEGKGTSTAAEGVDMARATTR